MRVLIIEDEKRLAYNVARSLREACGYAIDVALNGEDGLFMALETVYDAICLDMMLPRLDGEGVLRGIRTRKCQTPVLMLTAKDDTTSIVAMLNLGADDYLGKPFDLEELRARLQALIRRSNGHSAPLLTVADLSLDVARALVKRAGRVISLAPMEFRVLEYLLHHEGRIVSKTQLLEHLYDVNWEKFSNVVEVYISGLRKKIDAGAHVKLIHTLRGHGYVIRAEQAE